MSNVHHHEPAELYCEQIVHFDGEALIPPGLMLKLRLERESAFELFRRLLPRSQAERHFKRKTIASRKAVAMNAGLIAFDGLKFHNRVFDLSAVTILLVYRLSLTEWGPSDLHIVELGDNWNTIKFTPLSLAHKLGGTWYGPPWREDARLFPLKGQLGISYTVTAAYERNKHGYQVWQRQAFGQLHRSLVFENIDLFLPLGNNSNFASTIYPFFEKNWLFFEAI